MDLKEIRLQDVDLFIWLRIGRGDGALVNTAMNCRVPRSAANFSRGSPLVGFSASIKVCDVSLLHT
jgi:hypothetical protein